MKLLVLILALVGAAQARRILADSCKGQGLFPVPGSECSDKFWSCSATGATPVEMSCAAGTVFDPSISSCNFASAVSSCPYVTGKCPGAGSFANGAICSSKFWSCTGAGDTPVVMQCPNTTYFNAYSGVCDYADNTPDCNGECATLYYAVKATPELSILNAALVATGLDTVLDNSTLTSTIFLPTNEAFLALVKATGFPAANLTASDAPLSEEVLPVIEKVLLTHVVPGVAAYAANLTNAEVLPTLNSNQTLTVDLATPNVVKIVPEGGPAATVVFPDLVFCNSIAHVIDAVLVPSNLV